MANFESAFDALNKRASSMYWDICTVTRRVPVSRVGSLATTVEDRIMTSFLCRLSAQGLPQVLQNEPQADTKWEAKLFADSDVDVKAGDRLRIERKAGDVLTLKAADVYRFRSHAEILLSEKEEA